jgi:hypothetical protein
LAATWLVCVWLFYLGQWKKNGPIVMSAILVGFIMTAGWLQMFYVSRDRGTMGELNFLREVGRTVPKGGGEPLMVNAAGTVLEFFRLQYYLPDDAVLLHNLSFLRSDQIKSPAVYVVARASDEPKMKQLGDVQVVLKSVASFGEKTAADRFTLFHVTFAPGLARYPVPTYIGVMEAMERKKGPWCGGEW